MRVRCGEGSTLSWEYKRTLNRWGVAEINWRASQLIPVGPVKLKALAQLAKDAEAEYAKTRHVYIQHIASCSACSGDMLAL